MTEFVTKAMNVKLFTAHTGLLLTPIGLHNDRKARTELTIFILKSKSYLFDWSELSASDKHFSRTMNRSYILLEQDGNVSSRHYIYYI